MDADTGTAAVFTITVRIIWFDWADYGAAEWMGCVFPCRDGILAVYTAITVRTSEQTRF